MTSNAVIRPAYQPDNIFAKILREEIPCKKVFENEFALAFYDIHPAAPLHVLVIPKGAYISFDDFSALASPEELTGFYRAVAETARLLNLPANGYRIVSNIGRDALQEVPHYHLHLLAGKILGPILSHS